jgi:ABC-type nitrate/sulfonate/bicarbonate transport system substrate-binding protein
MSRAAMLLAVLLAVASFAHPAAAAQKVTITLPSTDPDQGAFFIAAKKGYFAAEGLDVEFVYAGGGVATPGLMSGSVDGSASAASAITAALRDAPVRIVMVFENTPPYGIYTISPEIRTLADLKGKSIGISTRGDTFEIAARLALIAAGISPDAVGYTPLGTGAAGGPALVSGMVPAVVLTPAERVTMQDEGQLKNARSIAELSGKVHMPFAGFAMSQKMLETYPVLAKKIIRAIVKGVRYEEAFKKETIAIVGTYQKSPHPHASEVEYDSFMKAVTPDLTLSPEFIAADLGVRANLIGLPKEKIPAIDRIYDFSLVRAVNAELDASHWKPAR